MKPVLLLWAFLCISLHAKIHIIKPLCSTATHRSCIIDSEIESLCHLPNFDEIDSLRQAIRVYDNRYKIGIILQPIEEPQDDTQVPLLNVARLSTLAYLRNTALYTYDEFELNTIPEEVLLHKFSAEITQSKPYLHATIDCLDAVITNQQDVAELALSLNKDVWFIQEPNMPAYQKIEEKLHTIAFNEHCCNVAPLIHSIMRQKKLTSFSNITAEMSIGELIDKMTILEIKTERIDNPKKLENIWRELHALRFAFNDAIALTPELEQLIQELKAANEALWETEDLIRDKELEACFDDEFIKLARSVYLQNDARYRAKRSINELLGSRLIEEKSYKPYN